MTPGESGMRMPKNGFSEACSTPPTATNATASAAWKRSHSAPKPKKRYAAQISCVDLICGQASLRTASPHSPRTPTGSRPRTSRSRASGRTVRSAPPGRCASSAPLIESLFLIPRAVPNAEDDHSLVLNPVAQDVRPDRRHLTPPLTRVTAAPRGVRQAVRQ